MSWLGDIWNDITGKTAAEKAAAASREASDANMSWQQDALDWMKEDSAGGRNLRDGAMQGLGGLLGLDGYDSAGAMENLKNNPMYLAQMENINQQSDNALKSMTAASAATGGLRGGNYQRGLAETSFNKDQAQQNALANAYNQQMAGLSSSAGFGGNGVGGQMSNMGNVAGQGIMGAQNSYNNAMQGGFNNMMGLGQLGLGVAGLFSDERLKANVKQIDVKHGLPWYSWDWNDKANDIGLAGGSEGHLAGEVESKYPNAVYADKATGYKKVKYGELK